MILKKILFGLLMTSLTVSIVGCEVSQNDSSRSSEKIQKQTKDDTTKIDKVNEQPQKGLQLVLQGVGEQFKPIFEKNF